MSGAWENKPKLIIAIPHTGHVTMAWALAFRQLDHPPALYCLNRGIPLDIARNELASEVFKHDAEWLFFLDSDIIPPRDAIIKLMSHNLDIVGGLYYKRMPPVHPAMWRLAPKPRPEGKYIPIMHFQKGQLIECDVIGMGCTLIHRRVLERLEQPYFKWTQWWKRDGVSEDFYFCEKAKEAGFRIYCDTSIICRHEFQGYTADVVPNKDNAISFYPHIGFTDV